MISKLEKLSDQGELGGDAEELYVERTCTRLLELLQARIYFTRAVWKTVRCIGRYSLECPLPL